MPQESKDLPDAPQAPQADPADAETAAAAETQPDAEEKPEDNLPPVAFQAEDLGSLRKKLTITVPAERIDAKRDESIKELSSTSQVPGFRIGRAPRRLIEKRFGADLSASVKAAMIAEGYSKAIEQADFKVLGEPDFTAEKLDAIELPDSGPLTFDVEVEIQPEFELPELKGIPVARPSVEVTDANVDAAVENWRHNFGQFEPVEGPAQADDVLTADVAFQVEGGEKHDHPAARVAVRAQRVEGIALEDLGDKLAGAKAGDTVAVEAAVPDDYADESARGKKAAFTFAVKQVTRLRLPELDEPFARQFGLESIAALRDWIRERLARESASNQQAEMRRQVYEYLQAKTSFELPEGALSRMRERVLLRRANELMMRGVPREEIEKHVDQLSVAAGEEAARELKSLFILQRVAEQLKVTVEAGEVHGEIARLAAQYNRRPDNLRADLERRGALEQLYLQIQERKAIDRLLEDAAVSDAPPEPAPEDKAAEKPKPKAAKKKAKPKADAQEDLDAT